MQINRVAILLANGIAVEVEVNRTLFCQHAVRVEGIHHARTIGAACATGTGFVIKIDGATCSQRGSQCSDGKSFCDARGHDISFVGRLNKLLGKRAPGGFAYFAVQHRKCLANAPIAGYACQNTTTALNSGIQHLHTIRCEAG